MDGAGNLPIARTGVIVDQIAYHAAEVPWHKRSGALTHDEEEIAVKANFNSDDPFPRQPILTPWRQSWGRRAMRWVLDETG
ncbi:MAG TPA: hypothetical protein PKK74_01185 [Candidatus Methanoculleus thermohydrogenotrophicum]|nr:hypothetical protein [Candidatus Methanoculleus thermohydrogenotrophicum]NLM82010.1 hypothetical protein [Candidatus Methanoculleus thermohydrogenotrophicum]HOB17299.1 hypothetical protein [Candidatus Methanoculleus thermohydrogenotrophicum]HPZ37416.1 hypothetical protein [Candidatus Methanoculleus thermohydrogenotrophicum]HQC90907.1 hypothetical protein [Candidatus Methanoculleus thermohydrogenotrophicum]